MVSRLFCILLLLANFIKSCNRRGYKVHVIIFPKRIFVYLMLLFVLGGKSILQLFLLQLVLFKILNNLFYCFTTFLRTICRDPFLHPYLSSVQIKHVWLQDPSSLPLFGFCAFALVL